MLVELSITNLGVSIRAAGVIYGLGIDQGDMIPDTLYLTLASKVNIRCYLPIGIVMSYVI